MRRAFSIIWESIKAIVSRIDSRVVGLLHPFIHAGAKLLEYVGIDGLIDDIGKLVRIAVQVVKFLGRAFAEDERGVYRIRRIVLVGEEEILRPRGIHIAKWSPVNKKHILSLIHI